MIGRLTGTALVLALLAGTGVAFGLTQALKLEKSPITATKVDKTFAPLCRCRTARALIAFRLRQADRVTVSLERGGNLVRTLVDDRRVKRGLFRVAWDGRDADGAVVPEGLYRPRVHLAQAHRTIVLPNPIRVDTTPPGIALVGLAPAVLSPNGDHRNDVLQVRYRVSEPARAALFVNGNRRVLGRFQRLSDTLRWFGRVNGVPLRPGVYRLEFVARDTAGNRSPRTGIGVVRVRYLDLARRLIRTGPRGLVAVQAITDVPRVHWRLGPRSGTSSRAVRVRAPARPGRYALVVTAGAHDATAAVVVRRPRARRAA